MLNKKRKYNETFVKKLLPMSEIKPLNIPRYDEISVKGLLKEALEDKEINKYFPDYKEGMRLPPRDYFFTK
jgi:hypothetical protein